MVNQLFFQYILFICMNCIYLSIYLYIYLTKYITITIYKTTTTLICGVHLIMFTDNVM